MKKILLLLAFVSVSIASHAQELFVYTEPASNMPAHTISTRLTDNFGKESDRIRHRLSPEVMFGISKKFMMHTGITFSDMHTDNVRWESVYLYGKYRFLSVDDVHRHFRMALFAEATHSRNSYHYEEVNIQGDRS